jgi:hypothetical protein
MTFKPLLKYLPKNTWVLNMKCFLPVLFVSLLKEGISFYSSESTGCCEVPFLSWLTQYVGNSYLDSRCYYLVLVTYRNFRFLVVRLANTGSVRGHVMSHTVESQPRRADV